MRQRNQGPGNGDFLQGQYANYFEVGHNAFEFLLDFGQLYLTGSEAEGRMHTRIIASPAFTQRLVEVLSLALSEYEQTYGRVSREADEPGDASKANVRYMRPPP